MRRFLLFFLVPVCVWAQPFTPQEISRWKSQSDRVTIIRDQWGIAHVYGKSDADAVFGFLYAQCEDDFPRIEMNYINAVARTAEVEGESKLFHDLRMRLFYDTTEAILIYKKSPVWLKKLCDAFADGVNYYLHSHPEVKPLLLTRFQPWMPFLFSEGSIGGDIETISVSRLKEFYGSGKEISEQDVFDHDMGAEPEPRGSNGFAIAPIRSESGNALLLINPHTSFYFRPEIHVISEEGLNAYGAVTWGQFFIYQGFNQHCGWMHTSSQADAMDHYLETVENRKGNYLYKIDNQWLSVKSKNIRIAYKDGGKKSYREFTVYYTGHGPVIAKEGEHWLTIKLMKEPLKALQQSFLRTKATDLAAYEKTMMLKANSSNNTVFADTKGNIAYWHGNYIPKRDSKFDYSKPLDGSSSISDWKGLHEVNEIVHVYNPSNGWIQNCNSTPFTVSASSSPLKNNYPAYMAPDPENARGINAVRVLNNNEKFNLEKLIQAAYDPYLAGFEFLIPSLVTAYDRISVGGNRYSMSEPIQLLKQWDFKLGRNSVETTLAIYWGQELRQTISGSLQPGMSQLEIIRYMEQQTTDYEKVKALDNVLSELKRDFGTWNIGWGEVNRFQRLTGKIDETYDDNKRSYAVPYTSSFWGSLAAFGSRKSPQTKKMYGYVGNSFVAVVEFGKVIKAKSLLAGGVNNDPNSPHFADQAERYSQGNFKDVNFYKEDVMKHATRTYHPGK